MKISQRQTVEVDRELVWDLTDKHLSLFYEYIKIHDFYITKRLTWEEIFEEAENNKKLKEMLEEFLNRFLHDSDAEVYEYSLEYIDYDDHCIR